jgi:hypothetical protein
VLRRSSRAGRREDRSCQQRMACWVLHAALRQPTDELEHHSELDFILQGQRAQRAAVGAASFRFWSAAQLQESRGGTQGQARPTQQRLHPVNMLASCNLLQRPRMLLHIQNEQQAERVGRPTAQRSATAAAAAASAWLRLRRFARRNPLRQLILGMPVPRTDRPQVQVFAILVPRPFANRTTCNAVVLWAGGPQPWRPGPCLLSSSKSRGDG